MPKITVPLGGQFYESESLPISAQECINFYSVIPDAQASSKIYLRATPGISSLGTIPPQANLAGRGGHRFSTSTNVKTVFVVGEEFLVVVDGDDSFSYAAGGGDDIQGTGRVLMADNGTQIMVVVPDYSNQHNAYLGTFNSVTQLTDTDFDGPVNSITFIDGYFVFTKQDSKKFFISNQNDGTAYTSTDFENADADSGNNIAAFALGDILYIFGEFRFSGYQNIGGSGFPFQLIQGSTQSVGLWSPFAIVEAAGVMCFLGRSKNSFGGIYISDGGRPQKISTTAIDKEISSYPTEVLETAYVLQYSQNGAEFVSFTFEDNACFVYDFKSGLWHQRESTNSSGVKVPWRVASVIAGDSRETFPQQKLYVADNLSNKIGILDIDTYDEYGSAVVRSFTTPQVDNDGEPFFVDRLRLQIESGTALLSGQGSDPQISMSYSKDGGFTFSEPIERSAGQRAKRKIIPTWKQLGRVSDQICFKFEVSDPVKWVFRKLTAEIE